MYDGAITLHMVQMFLCKSYKIAWSEPFNFKLPQKYHINIRQMHDLYNFHTKCCDLHELTRGVMCPQTEQRYSPTNIWRINGSQQR